MEMEKRRSKGSFLSFFDWNGKSKKKLFCDSPNLPEISKQGKENVDNIPTSQLNRVKVEDSGANSSDVASCDFSCALSISSDDGCGSKAPGLVARLMGLDMLPVSTVSELSSTLLYGSNSLGSSRCHEDPIQSTADYCPADCINMPHKLEKSSWGSTEPEAKKVGNPAIRRFQTEMLPPKSAKPIPVTHNKLLSPIKSPGYKPPTNAAQIMDAASKIIEASPQQHMRNRMSSVGPSSVPLRILDLKERVEASQYASKRVDLRTSNTVNDKRDERSNNLYKGTPAFKGSEKNSSCHLASNAKPASLVILSKDNVQIRDTSTLDGKRGHMKKKVQNEVKPNQLSRSQKKQVTDQVRVVQQRAFTGQNSNVLRTNNQKQNSLSNKGISTSKVESNKPTTRTWSSESSTGARKTTNKGAVKGGNIESKRSSTRATDSKKEFTVSKRKSIPQKKRHTSRDIQNGARGSNSDDVVNNYENKSIKCNITTDGSTDQNAVSINESTDVISFTFTSPLRRSMPESQSSAEQVNGTSSRIDVNAHGDTDQLYPKKLSLSPPGLDIIDGDTLSILLERKFQELTSRISPTQCILASEESSARFRFSLEDKLHNSVSTTTREQDRSFYPDLHSNKSESMHDNGCSSSDILVLSMNQQLQTAEPIEETSCSIRCESGNDLGSQHSRAIAVFENPSFSESCLDSEDSAYGSTDYSSVQDEEVSNFSPIHESASPEYGAKWSEQNSSPDVGRNMVVKQFCRMSDMADFKRTAKMDHEYVKDILNHAKLMVEEFVTGQTNKVIMPNLFDLLENQSNGAENYEEHSKLQRKVLFDSVNECLELRCMQAFVGSNKTWPRWVESIDSKKSLLAEELYKEMLGFRNMEEEEMVDELVGKDMSIGHGKWLNFDIEAFEEGLDVELDIVANLINELVSDLIMHV